MTIVDETMTSACQRECTAEQQSVVDCMEILQIGEDTACLPKTLDSWMECCKNVNAKEDEVSTEKYIDSGN